MKKILIAILLLGLNSSSYAGYFRLMDISNVQQSASVLFDYHNLSNSGGMTDFALITHSTADGTIVPAGWQQYLPPEDWSPLAIGIGGSVHGNLALDGNMSFNLAPQLANAILGNVNSSSSVWLQALKSAMAGQGSGKLRFGWAEVGNVIQDGKLQPLSDAYPGHGPFPILGNAGRIEIGYSWAWGGTNAVSHKR